MRGGDFARSIGPATVDARGSMPAEAYQRFAGLPPTAPTVAVDTSLSSGVYSEATVTNVVSTLTPSITNLTFRRCHDTGYVTAGVTLTPIVLFPGFGGDGSEFTDADMRRLARAGFLVIVAVTRQHGSVGGSLHYTLNTQDALDILAAAYAAAVTAGAAVYGGGTCAGFLGASTGVLDAFLMLCRVPEAVLFIVALYGNHDLGVHPTDSYWAVVSPATRASLVTQVGDLAARSVAQLDPYVALDIHAAAARLLALPGAPPVFVGGDVDDSAVPIPSTARLVQSLRANNDARSRITYKLTTSSDAAGVRIRHSGGFGADGVIAFERSWMPAARAATRWTLPRELDGVRVLGWFRSLAVAVPSDTANNRPRREVWLDVSATPRASATAGRGYAADLSHTADGQFTLSLVTSASGYVEIRSGDDIRIEPITAGTPLPVDLGVAPAVADAAALAALGITRAFFSDEGGTVTGTTTVTKWTQAPGFGTDEWTMGGGTEPFTVTDADGTTAIEFASATTDHALLKTSGGAEVALVNFEADYTVFLHLSKKDTTANQRALSLATTGSAAQVSMGYSSGVDAADYVIDNGTRAIVNGNGLGGHTMTASYAKHTLMLRRRTNEDGVLVLEEQLDGGAISSSPITAGATVVTPSRTVIGAGWGNGGGVFYVPGDWRFYAVCSAARAFSGSEAVGVGNYLSGRFTP